MEHILKGSGYKLGIDWLSTWYAGDPHSETAWRARVRVPLRFLLENDRQRSKTTASGRGGDRVS